MPCYKTLPSLLFLQAQGAQIINFTNKACLKKYRIFVKNKIFEEQNFCSKCKVIQHQLGKGTLIK